MCLADTVGLRLDGQMPHGRLNFVRLEIPYPKWSKPLRGRGEERLLEKGIQPPSVCVYIFDLSILKYAVKHLWAASQLKLHCIRTRDLVKQLTMAALWCTNLYSGAWSAHASVLTVLASLAIHVKGPHRPKASMWGVRSKAGLIIFKNRKTGVWDTDRNLLGLGWGGVTALVWLGFFEAWPFWKEGVHYTCTGG